MTDDCVSTPLQHLNPFHGSAKKRYAPYSRKLQRSTASTRSATNKPYNNNAGEEELPAKRCRTDKVSASIVPRNSASNDTLQELNVNCGSAKASVGQQAPVLPNHITCSLILSDDAALSTPVLRKSLRYHADQQPFDEDAKLNEDLSTKNSCGIPACNKAQILSNVIPASGAEEVKLKDKADINKLNLPRRYNMDRSPSKHDKDEILTNKYYGGYEDVTLPKTEPRCDTDEECFINLAEDGYTERFDETYLEDSALRTPTHSNNNLSFLGDNEDIFAESTSLLSTPKATPNLKVSCSNTEHNESQSSIPVSPPQERLRRFLSSLTPTASSTSPTPSLVKSASIDIATPCRPDNSLFGENPTTPKAPLRPNRRRTIGYGIISGNEKFVEEAILAGDDPNMEVSLPQSNKYDRVLPLLAAASTAKLPVVKALLDGGAVINSVNHLGQTALHVLAQCKIKDEDNDTCESRAPFHAQTPHNIPQLWKDLKRFLDNLSETSTHTKGAEEETFVKKNNISFSTEALDSNKSTDNINKNRFLNGKASKEKLEADIVTTAELLLERGIDVDHVDSLGRKAVEYAQLSGLSHLQNLLSSCKVKAANNDIISHIPVCLIPSAANCDNYNQDDNNNSAFDATPTIVHNTPSSRGLSIQWPFAHTRNITYNNDDENGSTTIQSNDDGENNKEPNVMVEYHSVTPCPRDRKRISQKNEGSRMQWALKRRRFLNHVNTIITSPKVKKRYSSRCEAK